MNYLYRAFSEHPASVGENYWQHLLSALSFSGVMAIGSVACFVHALFPFLFKQTGKGMIERLYQKMVTCRHRTQDAVDAQQDSSPGLATPPGNSLPKNQKAPVPS